MSVYKRPNSRFWWWAYRDGKKIMRGSTGTDNRDIALAIERTIMSARRRSTPGSKLHAVIDALLGTSPAAGLPLAGVWIEYEQHVRTAGKRLARITLEQRRQRCANLADWAKIHRPAVETAEAVDRATASAYATHLAKQGRKTKTRANIISDLATIWTALQKTRDGIDANPWRLVTPEITDSERGRAFTPDQEARVLKAAEKIGHGWWLACMIARHTGLRFGDVARLTWSMIDLERGIIAANPAKTARHGISIAVPISTPLLAALRTASGGGGIGPLFAGWPLDTPHPWPRDVPFRAVLAAAGIGEGYTFHSWRHTFRTRLAEAGVDAETSKLLGGWTQDRTAERYDHADHSAALREAVERAAKC